MSTQKDPSWLQAVDDMLAEDHAPGRIITKEWLCQHFDMPEPGAGSLIDHQRYQLAFLKAMDSFRATLLTEHKIALDARPGVGYEIVDPNAQADLAITHGVERLRRDLRWMGRMVKHVDHAKLTSDGAKATADAAAKVAALAGMVRKADAIQAPSVPAIEKK